MQQFTHFIKDDIISIIRKAENDAKIKIWEEINRQLSLLREKLRFDNVPYEEIEKILKDVAEKQYQISIKEFNKIFLLKQEEVFPSRVIKKRLLKNEV